MITYPNLMNSTNRRYAAALWCAALLLALGLFTGNANAQQDARSASTGSARAEPTQPSGVNYSLIVERNIFDRNRSRIQQGAGRSGRGGSEGSQEGGEAERPRAVSAPPDPGADLVLTGVSQNEGRYLAFFENARTGQVYAVAAGETLAGRRISEMTLDRVSVEQEGRPTHVVVGYTMLGVEAPRRASSAPAVNRSGGTRGVGARGGGESGNARANRGQSEQNNRPGGFGGFGGFGGNQQGGNNGADNDDSNDGDQPVASPGGVDGSNNDVLQRLLERRQRERQER